MATNVLKGLAAGLNGYDSTLIVYNRTASKADPLKSLGARVAADVGELAGLDVVFSITANDASAEAVFASWLDARGEDSKPASYIDCSTILPSSSRSLALKAAAKGVTFLSCPVFGRPDVAAIGKLTALLAGGDAELRTRLIPLVSTFGGAAVRNLGDDAGLATAAKLTGNFLIGAQIELGAEFLTLGEKLGVATPDLLHIHSLISTVIAPKYANYLVKGDFATDGGFGLDLALKDIGHVRSLAQEVSCPTPTADLVFNSLLSARARYGNSVDWGAIYLAVRNAAGLE